MLRLPHHGFVQSPFENSTMRHTLLAIDDVSLPLRKNVCLYLSKPQVRARPVLEPSPTDSLAPDNLATHFYGTVLHDAGTYRMWYYACHRGTNPDWPAGKAQQIVKKPNWLIGIKEGFEVYQGPLCYAESDDGITWRKPPLGQVLFKGSRENNAIDLPQTLVSGAAVIKDDADPDPNRRYKMVYQFFPDQADPVIPEFGKLPSIACAVSPDGLKWTVTAIPFINQFVEHCSFIRHNGQYIVHYQTFPGSSWTNIYTAGASAGGRSGMARSTYDFDHWPDLWSWAFALPEPADPTKRGGTFPYDQVHLGIGAASLGNVCVGVYGLWHSQAFTQDFAKITCDLGLVISNDGLRFREVDAAPGTPFISQQDSLATPEPGRDFNTILCQGNGILNVGDETRIYHGRWRNSGINAQDIASYYRAEVALATLPRDRWGALGLNPKTDTGTIVSLPILIKPGMSAIILNADGLQGIKVDLLDEHYRPIPGFEDGLSQSPQGLDCPVLWPGHGLDHLVNQTIRIQIRLQKHEETSPRVFAAYVQ
jgi:hypothetical protein